MKDSQRKLSQIKDSVIKLYEAGIEKKRADKVFENVKKKEQLNISNFMFSNLPKGQDSFEIDIEADETSVSILPVRLRVTRIRRKKIIWDLNKLKKKIPKSMYKQVVNKTYTINDMEGLTTYLKKCGVEANKFKKYIDVSESINEKAIEQAYEFGEIDKSDINGCYEIQLSEPYIKMTELKND